ncbi:TsaD/Kae1/Qri7 protein, required for threonylcarbamoyladenosine t(6)A37 formation in tRNA [Chitinispirillum alkaliphilum]|nr:TsaD/Kae1/Qri7 protein, required for threonylcarbamoyladenosine t(6)A37 formation in tRNA [Chitinispirillum alkaliphilum]
MIVLGIETSCDETSAAILRDGKIISSALYSQVEHSLYGGVVPEIASRAHMEKIDTIVSNVIGESKLQLKDIDLLAVSDSPGLAGALLVGISYALGIHSAHNTPVTGVNHLEGHISALFLSNPQIPVPFLALVVSGGHTAIYLVENFGKYRCIGQTVDDAAGEAFDKAGKLLGFRYPAGRAIENEAAKASGADLVKFPVAKVSGTRPDFSFSGLKTALRYFINSKSEEYVQENKAALCKAFQKAIIDSLAKNIQTATEITGIHTIGVVGGVACNGRLREEFMEKFGEHTYFPPPNLCTDNGDMIAMAGYLRAKHNRCQFPRMNPSAAL